MKKLMFLFAVALIASSCTGYENRNKRDASQDTTGRDTVPIILNAEVHSNPQPQQTNPSASLPAEIVHFRIQNSVTNTDRTIACKASIDEELTVMTLEALSSSDVFKLVSTEGGIFVLYFYNSDGLQATKTVYRRSDMETDSETQIYTSRTGEIIITLSYS